MRQSSGYVPGSNVMIKAIFIRGKTYQSNLTSFSDIELFRYVQKHFDPADCSCSHCGAKGCFIRSSSYSRMLITIENGIRKDYSVDVTNLLCQCGHWHALLSDILIPYGSYTARFILYVLEQYLHRSCTVEQFCNKWQIAVSTLYVWIHRFTDHFSLWAGIMRTIRWVTQSALDEVLSYIDFAYAFFQKIKAFSFLQGYLATDSRHSIFPFDSS